MPGTILVSVLEFMGLPLSSSTSLTVSMGKTVYQVSEKGDFSFPLTSLRNDLIVLLQDVDGNEIWRIEAKSIVEKGGWEDFFPLGSGHLHLKLQFILNDQEREKIRIMRQSALKKKQDELLDSSPRSATTSARSAALPLCANDEIKIDQLQYLSQAVDHTQLQPKGLMKKSAIHSPSMEDPQRAIGSKERGISSMDNLMPPNLENSLGYSEKQNPLGKTPTPGNVRKMNATSFETGTGTEVSHHGEIHKIEESKSKNSDDKISAGPVNQVIKVAIIVGFGILVLLTRQRKSR
ncbi:hypothetical protein L6164_011723 [Bauhinia variegata]|uniref:Uncharacterized protein n=1 Tax=Bauhinia variegata TaxID=167791 RepID=A0ACB9P7T1_BAUVA|nr:hypothetical protein L6164_011723 [Bauhinia variegata]